MSDLTVLRYLDKNQHFRQYIWHTALFDAAN